MPTQYLVLSAHVHSKYYELVKVVNNASGIYIWLLAIRRLECKALSNISLDLVRGGYGGGGERGSGGCNPPNDFEQPLPLITRQLGIVAAAVWLVADKLCGT